MVKFTGKDVMDTGEDNFAIVFAAMGVSILFASSQIRSQLQEPFVGSPNLQKVVCDNLQIMM